MISDPVMVAMIAAVPPTVISLVGLIVTLNSNKKIEQVHIATNSMKDALVSTTASDSRQKGHSEGVADQKAAEKGNQ